MYVTIYRQEIRCESLCQGSDGELSVKRCSKGWGCGVQAKLVQTSSKGDLLWLAESAESAKTQSFLHGGQSAEEIFEAY